MPHRVAKKLIKDKLREIPSTTQKIDFLKKEISEFPNFATYHKLKREFEEEIRKLEYHHKHTVKHPTEDIRKQGRGTICLIGMPNAGKSSLMKRLTNADPEVANYAFTTKTPYSGMFNYEKTPIQVIEIPGLYKGAAEGVGKGKQFLAVARNADLLAMMVDLADNPKEKYLLLKQELEKASIQTKKIVICTKTDLTKEKQQFEEKTIYINNKSDLTELKEVVFKELELIRVYAKKPREKPDFEKPFIVKKRTTAEKLLEKFPKEFQEKTKEVRVWGSSKFQGQKVPMSYELKDKDVIQYS